MTSLKSLLSATLVFSLLSGCGNPYVAPKEIGATTEQSTTPIAAANITQSLVKTLESKNLTLGSPVFLRIVKNGVPGADHGRLDAFVEDDGGQYILAKSWDICTWSGDLGPKVKEGDGQSPEGFYFVTPTALNPNSQYHLSFNLGFPNAYDRHHGRTGSFLMVHGDCVSIGCYAMTNQGIEEIYALVEAAVNGGQPFIRVHIFPFPMTDKNMNAYDNHEHAPFWRNLKEGWDSFQQNKKPPDVQVNNGRYIFKTSD